MTKISPIARSTTFILLILSIVVALPLIALSFYNHPSPADDYCFASTSMQYGFWQSQQFYYDGWSGRFFHNFLVHGSPLTYGWYGGYKVYPVILLCLLALGFYALASQFLHGFTITAKLGLAAGLFVGFIATLASLSEYMYWYAGMACYSLSTAFLLFLLATLIAHQRRGFGTLPGYLLLESFLLVCIIGSSETGMVMAMSVLGLIAFAGLLQNRRISATTLILFAVGGIACYYLITAPGNAVRMGSNPNSANIPKTLISALKFSAGYIVQQLFLTPLLPLSLLYLPLTYKLTGNKPLPAYLRVHPFLGMLHGAATLIALISLHFYGVGVAPALRLVNIFNLMFWLSWTYNLTLLIVTVRHRIQVETWTRYSRPIAMITLIWTALAIGAGPVLPLAYGDWLSGRASRYDQAMQERYQQMTQSESDTALIKPLPDHPASMFLEDVKNDPKHLWNRCWADYYHKKTIVLQEKAALTTH
ncbi:DUF6056 family protein [Spirosoma sp. SC4-14]|uniref:DUF6056 family protein n=1 Tax=Spirosoma sp. SC4-14 TaxID=3128900 RepID=UPI0030D4C4EE